MFKILSWQGKGLTANEFDKEGKTTADYLQQYVKQSRVIVDWGSGIGRVAKHVALNNSASAIHCVDVSEDMIELGRRYCSGIANITWQHWTGKKLPVREADFVYSLLTFQHNTLRGTERALREIARMLRGIALLEFPTPVTDDPKAYDEKTVRVLLQKYFVVLNMSIYSQDLQMLGTNVSYYHYLVSSR
jgi:ubiquinone/menaquinone biosynthesis C-methylase UbiE